jgi:hypothetical protein
VIPFLGVHQGVFSGYYRATCTPMIIAIVFTETKVWKQPRCSTSDEWVKKMWYIYTREFYSVLKNNEIMLFVGK